MLEQRESARIAWLNPLLRLEGYTRTAGDAVVLHGATDGMLAVHHVTRLEELAGAISALMHQ